MINCCWFGFKWTAMLAVVAGAVVAFYLYRQINDEIRCRAEDRIAQHYKGLKVSVRAAQLVEGKGIRLYDLSVSDPSIEGQAAELLRVEETMLECPTDWQELLKGDLAVHRVTFRRPMLRMIRQSDGAWSAGKLLPPPHFGDQPPEVIWENGTVEIFDPHKSPASTLAIRDVNLIIAPTPAEEAGSQVSRRRLQGTLAGDGFRRVELDGWLDIETSAISIRGKAEGVEVSPELRNSLPDPLATKLSALGDLRGQVQCVFQVEHDQTAAVPLRFEVSAQLTKGQIDDRRLPQSLTDIHATVRLNNAGYAIDELTAKSGRATLQISCSGSGFEPTSPMQLTAQVRQLELDPALLNVLPPSLQEVWRHYSPAGPINADVQLSFDGKTWRPQFTLNCLDVAFEHHKFRYRLYHSRGSIVLKDDLLKVDLTAYSGRQPVHLTAEVKSPFSGDPIGRFDAEGSDLQIDEALIVALQEKPQQVVRSLDPQGTVSIQLHLWRKRADETMHLRLVLDVNNGSVRFNGFPYQLTGVRGTLEMVDHDWHFRNLTGVHSTARVTCEGDLMPGLQGRELALHFTARDVPLEEELRNALSLRNPHIQQVWLDTRPLGVVDLTADVKYLIEETVEEKKFSVNVNVKPQRETTSIEPVHFPYRIERIQGDLIYRDGHIDFKNFKGEHGPVNMPVKIATEGYCDFERDGHWVTHFDKLSVDQVHFNDRELSLALPDRLKKAVAELNPTGAMNLRGSFELERTSRPGEPLRSRWDVRVGLQQNSLRCGDLLLENICGEMAFRGEFDGQHLRSRGELALDSLSYKDYQLTRVMGPMGIDDDRVLFGGWVDDRNNGLKPSQMTGPLQTPRSVTAGLFGGTIYGEGWVALGVTPRYGMNIKLADASLARCAQEAVAGRQKLRGKVAATIALTGSGRTRNLLSGSGEIRLSEADVYELPVMLSLLKILSIRPPDQNAFSDATIYYRIEGEHIYFNRIDFHGDAISLRGSGQMNFQSQIELTFYCLVGRGELEIPIVKQVLRAASQQLMRIRVGGTLQNPETTQEALPELNQALQQIRNELENRK